MDRLEISRFRRALDNLRDYPDSLRGSQAETFVRLIRAESSTKAILESLEARVRPIIGQRHSVIVNQPDSIPSLEFPTQVDAQALLGLSVLGCMLDTFHARDHEAFAERVAEIGWRLGTTGALMPRDKRNYRSYVETFVRVLVQPLVDYLEFAVNREDLIHSLMSRYKRRSEWFHSAHLIEIAASTDRAVEESLKRDFYAYLFDEGLDFTVAPHGPGSASEVDVLTARFPDGTRLVCEAKVFDSKGRTQADVTSGISQAAQYSDQWGEPRAYVLVYNIAQNTQLNLRGVQRIGDLWSGQLRGRSIYVAGLDLAVSVPATKASAIRTINIDWPAG